MIRSKSFSPAGDPNQESPTPIQNRLRSFPAGLGTVWARSKDLKNFSLPLLSKGRSRMLLVVLLVLGFAAHSKLTPSFDRYFQPSLQVYPPLAMADGDPYIRALMRTISASESNDREPYGLLYGGQYFTDWSHHPDQCIVIQAGPNQGDCTTAAGRYQFITTTWAEKAERYHLNSNGWLFWQTYSFDPMSQDVVVYRWLKDPEAWNADIPALLRAGQLNEVLYRLSPTWTSLGYGIETNDMTPHLDALYQKFLQEEHAHSSEPAS